jgi:nicotinamidase/pyrazinamidase
MKTVFVDVDTQLDFVYPSGALYVPGAELVVPHLAQLNRYAAAHGIPVLSTVDAHAEDDVEFKSWPHHCVAGALGQRKAETTLIDGRVVVPNRAGAIDIAGARQIVLEKQTVNAFDTVTIAAVLEQLNADRFVVYGVVTEICVLWAVRGLLKAGKQVTVVAEAVKELDAANRDKAFDEIRSAGGTVASIAAIIESV